MTAGRTVRLRMARHAAFYAPVIISVAGGFLETEGLSVSYGVAPVGTTSVVLLKAGEADIIQSGPSSSFMALDRGETNVPRHVAGINDRDGFFLVGRHPVERFDWKALEGATLLADPGTSQPQPMLRYCLRQQGVEWDRVKVLLIGGAPQMTEAFRQGTGDYAHLQQPAPEQLALEGVGHVVASVGEVIGPVAFSSLAVTPKYLAAHADTVERFVRGYQRAVQWIADSDAPTVAEALHPHFADVAREALTTAVQKYKDLGTWAAAPLIPEASYSKALDVFAATVGLQRRHPYSEVVFPDFAQGAAPQS